MFCFSFHQSGAREPKAGKGDQSMETEEITKPIGPQMTKKSTELINPEKGLGLDNAIIHSINCCCTYQWPFHGNVVVLQFLLIICRENPR